MANGSEEKRRHFILEGVTEAEPWRSPVRGGGKRPSIPERDRARHGGALQRQIGAIQAEAKSAREVRRAAGVEEGLGLHVEFASFPEIELAFESLAREHPAIEHVRKSTAPASDDRAAEELTQERSKNPA